ncbi:MAG: LysR family transcriptional regulator [Hyphococcus sp.]|nr:MAG: LysR family transcriptional regulator [Marinicaulis sp.]
MVRSLPPLNAARAFEVAARHKNFSRAAEELGVTQGAVSKQIISLEEFIGAQLFERLPDGLVLTVEGRELASALTPAFDKLSDAFARYSRRAPRSRRFRLATVASFASQFMIPRLDVFEKDLPGIELEILTSDRAVDLAREEIDLSVRFGGGEWSGLVSTELVSGTLVPVCAPSLQVKEKSAENILSTTRRLQVFANNEWRKWEKETGATITDASPPFIMEHFLVAMQAVLAGQGVAILPEIIVRDHISTGAMVQFAAEIEWQDTFHLAHLPNAERRPMVRDVIEWLKSKTA